MEQKNTGNCPYLQHYPLPDIQLKSINPVSYEADRAKAGTYFCLKASRDLPQDPNGVINNSSICPPEIQTLRVWQGDVELPVINKQCNLLIEGVIYP